MSALTQDNDVSRLPKVRDFTPDRSAAGNHRISVRSTDRGLWSPAPRPASAANSHGSSPLKGLNLVLAARSEDRLERLGEDLVAANNIAVRTVPVDLGRRRLD